MVESEDHDTPIESTPPDRSRLERAPHEESPLFRWVRIGLDLLRVASVGPLVIFVLAVANVVSQGAQDHAGTVQAIGFSWLGLTTLGLATCIAAPRSLGGAVRWQLSAGALAMATFTLVVATGNMPADDLLSFFVVLGLYVGRASLLLLLRKIAVSLGRERWRRSIDRVLFALFLHAILLAGYVTMWERWEPLVFFRSFGVAMFGVLVLALLAETILLFKIRRAIAPGRLSTLSEVFD